MFFNNKVKIWMLSVSIVLLSSFFNAHFAIKFVKMVSPKYLQALFLDSYWILGFSVIFAINICIWFFLTFVNYLLAIIFDSEGTFSNLLWLIGFGYIFIFIGTIVNYVLITSNSDAISNIVAHGVLLNLDMLTNISEMELFAKIQIVSYLSLFTLIIWASVAVKVQGKLGYKKFGGFLLTLSVIVSVLVMLTK